MTIRYWFLPLLASVFLSTSSEASDLSVSLARWKDPLTPPQTRTECNRWASGNIPFGGEWKTCISWGLELRWMQVEVQLRLVLPSTIPDEKVAKLRSCGQAVAGSVGQSLDGTPSTEIAMRMKAATPDLEKTFWSCVADPPLRSKVSFQVSSATSWSDWKRQ